MKLSFLLKRYLPLNIFQKSSYKAKSIALYSKYVKIRKLCYAIMWLYEYPSNKDSVLNISYSTFLKVTFLTPAECNSFDRDREERWIEDIAGDFVERDSKTLRTQTANTFH